jgi:hypothetical protein
MVIPDHPSKTSSHGWSGMSHGLPFSLAVFRSAVSSKAVTSEMSVSSDRKQWEPGKRHLHWIQRFCRNSHWSQKDPSRVRIHLSGKPLELLSE